MIPVIIMGGILTGWFTPTEAGMIASVYILVVLVPLLNRGHIRNLPRDFVYTGLLYSIPLALVAAASAFGWMLAYLRGPDIVAGWIELFAGHDGRIIMLLLVLLFIIIGDFMDAVPAIIIFMPIVIKLTELGNIKPLHMGVVIITTLVFGLITPPYGLSLLVASKFVGVRFTRAMFASLPIYVVFFVTIAFTVLFPGRRALSAEAAAAGIGRLLQEPERQPATSARRSVTPRRSVPLPLMGRVRGGVDRGKALRDVVSETRTTHKGACAVPPPRPSPQGGGEFGRARLPPGARHHRHRVALSPTDRATRRRSGGSMVPMPQRRASCAPWRPSRRRASPARRCGSRCWGGSRTGCRCPRPSAG